MLFKIDTYDIATTNRLYREQVTSTNNRQFTCDAVHGVDTSTRPFVPVATAECHGFSFLLAAESLIGIPVFTIGIPAETCSSTLESSEGKFFLAAIVHTSADGVQKTIRVGSPLAQLFGGFESKFACVHSVVKASDVIQTRSRLLARVVSAHVLTTPRVVLCTYTLFGSIKTVCTKTRCW